jgi:D-serine deaminase-like pyridoxal phosphate-dependent protein
VAGPNAELIGRDLSIAPLDTPALILDLDRFESNVATAAATARQHGVHLRPHAKTHKCIEVARRQIRAGALGISVASVREAEKLGVDGIPSILLTAPIASERKASRLANIARRGIELICAVGTLENVSMLGAAARAAGCTIGIVVDLDIGMGRTGAACPRDALAVARHAATVEGILLRGLQAYSGLIQHIGNYEQRAGVYRGQLRHLHEAIGMFKEVGLTLDMITGGGTGTMAVDFVHGPITDHQAGSYVFMDRQYSAVTLSPDARGLHFDNSLFLRSTVVSRSHPGKVTVDAGTKALALESPPPAPVHLANAEYSYFGDEHGLLTGTDLPFLGAAVDLIPAHCDTAVNLHDFLHIVRGSMLVDIWPIDARGTL